MKKRKGKAIDARARELRNRKRAMKAKATPAPKVKARKLRKFATRLKADVAAMVKEANARQETRTLDQIKIGKRVRTDMGDIAGLKRSIEDRGTLLHAVVINERNDLIAGQRRMVAWSISKFRKDKIPVRVVTVDNILKAERDENDERKDWTPSEAVALKMAIEPEVTLAAQLRQHGGKKVAADKGRALDAIAAYVGMSRPSIQKAEAVVCAAEADPERFGKLVADMDRTGKVNGPFHRLKIMLATDAIRAAPPAVPQADAPYEVCVIDYPWPQEPNADQATIDASGRSLRPYPAMAIEEGVKFLRGEVAPRLAKKCTVYFWTTMFHVGYALDLLRALGFKKHPPHATGGAWAKDEIGRGRILRDQAELCLIAHRGGALIAHTDDTTLWQGPGWETRENSRKPVAFYALVERKSPAARYLSIFSTGDEGTAGKWDHHGDQVGKFAKAIAADVVPDKKPRVRRNKMMAAEVLAPGRCPFCEKLSRTCPCEHCGEPDIPDEDRRALQPDAPRETAGQDAQLVFISAVHRVAVEFVTPNEWAQLALAKRNRAKNPDGHAVEVDKDMSTAFAPGAGEYVLACGCGWCVHQPIEHEIADAERVDGLIEAHWRAIEDAAAFAPGDDDQLDIPAFLRRADAKPAVGVG